MAHSPLATRIVNSPNSNTRSGAKPRYIVHHHMATTGFEGVLESWRTGRKEGSAHVAIDNDGEKVGVIDEALRAWSLSSSFFDGQALVTEIANSSVGGSWPVSPEAHEAAAQVTANWCRRYGIPCTREFVIDHGEVYTRFKVGYATACAGGLDLDWIVARAVQILGGAAPAAAPATRPASTAPVVQHDAGWDYWEPNGTGVARRVQIALKSRGRYDGLVDDVFGVKSRKGVQQTLAISGRFVGNIDGVIEGGGCRGIQQYAHDFGDYTGDIDARLGINSWIGFALGLERP